jgi:hypothetical protein
MTHQAKVAEEVQAALAEKARKEKQGRIAFASAGATRVKQEG